MHHHIPAGMNPIPVSARTAACIAAAVFFLLSSFATDLRAQVVTHPTAGITSTVSYFSYTHMLSPTQKKEIKYMIVRASDGDIKTVFNACDVCYYANKGYSQSGTEVRCNNCGNRFAIDGLGHPNTSGTCNPGYLPRTIEGDNVVLKVSDLLTGAYYFPSEIVSSIDETPLTPEDLLLAQTRQELSITLPTDGRRTFRIYGLDGRLRQTEVSASRSVRISLARFAPGAYLLVVAGSRDAASKMFLVY